MKRLISYMIIGLFSIQTVFGSSANLKSIVDEHLYTLTVEWDQKDQQFAVKENQKFLAALRTLPSLSLQDFQQVFPFVDTAQLEAELQYVNLRDPEAVANFFETKKSNLYAKGVSWEADGPAIITGVSIVALVVFLYLLSERQTEKYYDCVDANGGNHDACL